MKKLLVLLFSLLFLSSSLVYADTSAADARKIERERILNIIIEEGKERSENNPGFRNLKPGITPKQHQSLCDGGGSSCFGIQNIKFDVNLKRYRKTSNGEESKKGALLVSMITLDMGPIVSSDGSFFSQLNNLVVSSGNEANIYLKMKKNFDAKYNLDYEYSERDRQLFNEGEKEELLGVYENGQVVLKINLKNRNLWLYIEYRDVDLAKSFLEENTPITSTLDDF